MAEGSSKEFLKTQHNYARSDKTNACQYLEPIENQKYQQNSDDSARIAVQVKMVQDEMQGTSKTRNMLEDRI